MEAIKKLVRKAAFATDEGFIAVGKQIGLSVSQMIMLDCLHDHGGQTTQRQIEADLGIKRSTTAILVSKMIDQGLVLQITSPNDKRMKILTMTDKGKKLAEPIAQFIKEDEAQLEAKFSSAELTATRKVLSYIISRGEFND